MNQVLFCPLRKADAKQRIVAGTAASEIPDRDHEVFDYESSKPHFIEWSENAKKASGGKSAGNVRGMHSMIAAGKLTDIGFDDRGKSIYIEAKILDDGEWRKVENGVYTGFSIGGQYLRKWSDGALRRYTAKPSEISLVDLPCNPSCGFELIKRDGSSERRAFRQINDDHLLKAGLTAQSRLIFAGPHSIDGSVSHVTRDQVRRRAPHGIGGASAHPKTVFGAVSSITHGILFVSHETDADGGSLNIHGHSIRMSDLDTDLKSAIYSTAAAFNRAETEAEQQVNQARIVGLLVTEAMRRDARLSDRIREIKERERYD
jgi:hypothetical protein